MEALGITPGYLLIHALSFGILFVVLRAWVYKPILGVLERRRLAIARGLEDARVAADARSNAEREANRILSEARVQAAELLREATERAGKAEQEIRARAESEALVLRDTSRAEIESERNRMLSELRGQIGSLVIAATKKVIQANVDENRQYYLVDEFFSGICNGKVKFLQSVDLAGARDAEITSALPLRGGEEAFIRDEIRARLGDQVTVGFRVDPSILGGLLIQVGDQLVDGSVSGKLEDLRVHLR